MISKEEVKAAILEMVQQYHQPATTEVKVSQVVEKYNHDLEKALYEMRDRMGDDADFIEFLDNYLLS